MLLTCPQCKNTFEKGINYYNRAVKMKLKLYCSRICSGLARRSGKSKQDLIDEKREYDRLYRENNYDLIKQKKKEYFQKTYDKKQAAIKRKERMPKHIEYCRKPEYRKKKAEYDKLYRAKLEFGDFAEAAVILVDIEKMLDKKEIKYVEGLINKAQKRKKEWKNLQQAT